MQATTMVVPSGGHTGGLWRTLLPALFDWFAGWLAAPAIDPAPGPVKPIPTHGPVRQALIPNCEPAPACASKPERVRAARSGSLDPPQALTRPSPASLRRTGYGEEGVARYQTMRGRRVERRFGWDCHGLPAEVEAEKQLGISTEAEILDLGVDRFNDACRASVLRYTQDWERYVTRQARWVDFANDYKTLDTDYMESVLWAFKTLYDKGLVYEGFRVLAYCWRCETPLSNTETRMDDVYRDRQDPALTVALRLDSGEQLWVWTTTPWTLPSNLAVAVGPDIEYAVFARDGDRVILGAARVPAYARELSGYTRVGTMPGSALV